MRKLFKKSLACCLALALCFSLFAGAISANALTTNPAYSTEDVTVAPGESTTIKFTIKDFAEIQGVILKVYVPSVVASIDAVTVDGIELVEWSDETGEGNYQVDNENKFIKFMTLANFEGVDNVAALTFDIKVTVAADAEAGEYGYTAPVIQATDGDSLVTINGQFGKFTVEVKEPEHTHAYTGTAYLNTEDGKWYIDCECGESSQETDANVDTAIRHSSSILISEKFGITIGVLKAAVDVYDSFELVVTSKHYRSVANPSVGSDYYKLTTDVDKYVYVADDEEVPQGYHKQDEVSNVYLFSYQNLTAYEMTVDVNAIVYCYKDGKIVAVSETWTHNLAERALREYGKADTDIKRSLYVDAMNYGTEVQKYFANQYKASDLAANVVYPDAQFADYQKYATKDSVASADLCASVKAMNKTEYGNSLKGGVNLIISAANEIMYTWNPSAYDLSKVKVVIEYVDSYGKDKGETIYLSDLDSADNYAYSFSNVALYDGHKTINANVYEGDTLLATRAYSVESFAKEKAADSSLAPLCNQLAKLRYSCYEVLKSGFKN